MRWSFPLARFGETQVRVHATFFILLAWIAFVYYAQGGPSAAVQGVIFILALFLCVLLHEFGHVLAARTYGIPTPDITLLPIGGVARLQRMPEKPGQELVVALAGPAVNVVIALGIFLGLGGARQIFDAHFDAPAASMLGRLMSVNLFLVVFNMLPAFPMDGGRVLRALLAMRMDYARATHWAATAGQMFAILFGLAGLFVNPMLILIAVFVYVGAGQEASMAMLRQAVRFLHVSDVMITEYRTLPPGSTLDEAVEALLHTNQREFPIADESGQIVGLLTRDGLIEGLRARGPKSTVAEAMEKSPVTIQGSTRFDTAMSAMNESGLPAALVADRAGRIIGMLTRENVGEAVMVQSAVGNRAVS